jgi:hypothetical protein
MMDGTCRMLDDGLVWASRWVVERDFRDLL